MTTLNAFQTALGPFLDLDPVKRTLTTYVPLVPTAITFTELFDSAPKIESNGDNSAFNVGRNAIALSSRRGTANVMFVVPSEMQDAQSELDALGIRTDFKVIAAEEVPIGQQWLTFWKPRTETFAAVDGGIQVTPEGTFLNRDYSRYFVKVHRK